MAQEPVKVVVVLDGGLIQDVISAGVPVEWVVVDYDVEGADASEIVAVPQNQGCESDEVETAAVGGPYDATVDGPWALAAHTDKFGWTTAYSTNALKLFDTGDFDDEETIAALHEVGWKTDRAHDILDQHKADGA